jgi:coatomer protein complex subunit epsilon
MSDPLFTLRNNFYLGSYQAAINAGSDIQTNNSEQALEKDLLIYRCYIGLGEYQVVLDEISPSDPAPLQAVKLYATYKQQSAKSQDSVISTLKKWLEEGFAGGDTLLVIAATIFCSEGNYEEALRYVHQATSLEGKSIVIHILLKMNRPDLAEKELANMQAADDDSTLTQLAQAWVTLHLSEDRWKEAFYIFQELAEKYQPTPLLLVGQALCNMKTGRFEEAFELLQEALKSVT